MVWLKTCCLLLLAYIVHSSDLCKSENHCKCVIDSDKMIDLTSAGKIGSPLFHEIALDEQCNHIELYSYNPCFPFDLSDIDTTKASDQKPCSGAAACVKVPGGSTGNPAEQHAIGLQNTSKFGGDIAKNNFHINYTVPGTEKTLMVHLTCGTEDKQSLTVNKPECSGDQVVLNFTSKCACVNGCSSTTTTATPTPTPTPTTTPTPTPTPTTTPTPTESSPGMSTGSKLLIAFFTILLAYVIVGVLWNFCNGAQGAEILPNLAFWTDLPTLIMEGITFTCSCFSRKSTYGEV